MTAAFVGLGSNQGDRWHHLKWAGERLASLPRTRREKTSSVYETEVWGDPGEPAYLNAVAKLETELPPRELLVHLLELEAGAGRRSTRRGPRTLDLDILFFGSARHRDAELELPHPRWAERPFVLVPLVEIAPGWVDPVTGHRVDRLFTDRGRMHGVRWAGRFPE